jgi:hypothetical protein
MPAIKAPLMKMAFHDDWLKEKHYDLLLPKPAQPLGSGPCFQNIMQSGPLIFASTTISHGAHSSFQAQRKTR